MEPVIKKEDSSWWREPMLAFTRISSWIVAPILIALFIGKYLDKKWGTEPWAFVAVTGFAFLASCYGIIREVQKYSKDQELKQVSNDGKHTNYN
jgi:F0F1-type ATP synthase assembly protein I